MFQCLLVKCIPTIRQTNFEKQTATQHNMSYNRTSRSCNKKTKTKTPFCTVCHAAGLSKAVYTSHYVRDRPGGVVVCPTLLKVECRYCHKTGHTPKHCPEIKAREERRAKAERRAAKRAEAKVAPKPKKTKKPEPTKKQASSNAFAALLSDSDDEGSTKQVTCCSKRVVAKKQPEFPALGGGKAMQVQVQVQVAPGSSWASMVTKAPKTVVKKATVAPVPSTAKKEKNNSGFRIRSWADEMDSDNEDDDWSVTNWSYKLDLQPDVDSDSDDEDDGSAWYS